VTWAVLLVLGGCFVRIFFFSFDPHRIRNVIQNANIGQPLDIILFNVPILFWLDAGFLVVLYWVELTSMTGIKELSNISRFRPLFFGFMIGTAATILPIGVWEITGSIIGYYLYMAFIFFFISGAIVGVSFYSYKLRKLLQPLAEEPTGQTFRIFLKKVTNFVIGMSASLLAVIITLIIFVILNAITKAWVWLIMEFILRIEEFSIVMCILVLLNKRRPSSGNSLRGIEIPKPDDESVSLLRSEKQIK